MDGFLEYVPGDSFLHRLNPVTKIAFAIMFAIACFCTGNLVFLCLMLALGLALAASCSMMRQTLGLMKAVLAFSLVLAVLLLLTTPKGDLLVELPWGYIGSDSILAAVVTVIRLEAAANSFVKVLHVPYRYAFTFASTVHFIPVFMNDMRGIMEAQTARGVEFDQGGMVRKIRLMVPLCVPLLVSSVRKTNSSAIAAEVRGFNLRTRESGYKRYPMTGADWAVIALGVVVLAVAIALGLL